MRRRGLIVAALSAALLVVLTGHADAATAAYSRNYAGYEARGFAANRPQFVQAQWTVPAVTCPARGTYYAEMWPGLLAQTTGQLVQAGTESRCVNGMASYHAWWEKVPEVPSRQLVGMAVHPGDVIVGWVSYNPAFKDANGNYVFDTELNNQSTGQAWAMQVHDRMPVRPNVAECILEAPQNSATHAVQLLANFGTARFDWCVAAPFPLGSSDYTIASLAKPATASDGPRLFGWEALRETMTTTGTSAGVIKTLTSAPRLDGSIVFSWRHA